MAKEIKRYTLSIIGGIIGIIVIIFGIKFRWDKAVVGSFVFLIGLATQLFGWIAGVVGSIPVIGTFIVKFLGLPLLFLINALGNALIFIGVKMGFKREVLNGRLLVLIFVMGMLLGFIVGKML